MYKTELFKYLEEHDNGGANNTLVESIFNFEEVKKMPDAAKEQLRTLLDSLVDNRIRITVKDFTKYTISYGGEDKLTFCIIEDPNVAKNCEYRGNKISDCEIERYGDLVSLINTYDNVIAVFHMKGVLNE